jgi:glutamyl-tRNA synthetase/glutamyl-Q tRNA(Asp) synthetase
LHLGHVLNALFVWGLAESFGGRVFLRIEDHDRTRSKLAHEESLLRDLEWLGLRAERVARQSERSALYDKRLRELAERGLVYPCVCSRRDIAGAANGDEGSQATPGPVRETAYPGTCRERSIPFGATPARRVRMDAVVESFDDLALGRVEPSRHPAGDVLVRDRDGHWTYQFAVVVDDLDQGVDVVIRGADLIESTGRQIALGRLIGRKTPPRFLHHPLILRPDGRKLSKSLGDSGVRELREAGSAPGEVFARAAEAAGLLRVVDSGRVGRDLGRSGGRLRDALLAGDLGAFFAGTA